MCCAGSSLRPKADVTSVERRRRELCCRKLEIGRADCGQPFRTPASESLVENPSKDALSGEFLHGTRYKEGSWIGFGSGETHVENFIMRH
jgi:hypothetical protein